MKAKFVILPGFALTLVIAAATLSFTAKSKLSIAGVWSMVEVQTVKSDGSITSTIPTASEVIFSNKHYSFCWTSHVSTTRSWIVPDSVKLVRLNQSIINTGTYELADSLLVTKAVFAMNPMFVNGLGEFKCTYHGDTLVLTGLRLNSSDNIPNPLYANGSHIVNKLLKIKDQ